VQGTLAAIMNLLKLSPIYVLYGPHSPEIAGLLATERCIKGDLNQVSFSFIRFSCLGFSVLSIISVSLVCLDYFAKYLASQAVSNDAYVEEYISTKTSCFRIR